MTKKTTNQFLSESPNKNYFFNRPLSPAEKEYWATHQWKPFSPGDGVWPAMEKAMGATSRYPRAANRMGYDPGADTKEYATHERPDAYQYEAPEEAKKAISWRKGKWGQIPHKPVKPDKSRKPRPEGERLAASLKKEDTLEEGAKKKKWDRKHAGLLKSKPRPSPQYQTEKAKEGESALDELSQRTLFSYRKKAKGDRDNGYKSRNRDWGVHQATERTRGRFQHKQGGSPYKAEDIEEGKTAMLKKYALPKQTKVKTPGQVKEAVRTVRTDPLGRTITTWKDQKGKLAYTGRYVGTPIQDKLKAALKTVPAKDSALGHGAAKPSLASFLQTKKGVVGNKKGMHGGTSPSLEGKSTRLEDTLDEVSPAKLGRYINKSARDYGFENLPKTGDPRKARNRLKGIGRASRSLQYKIATKEETESKKKVNEHIPAGAGAGTYVDDFVHSKNSKFSGDSKKQRIKRALGAYYSKHKG